MFTNPDVLNLIFAVAGAVLGWILKHRQSSIPPEVAELLSALLSRQKEQRAHQLLGELMAAAKPPTPAA